MWVDAEGTSLLQAAPLPVQTAVNCKRTREMTMSGKRWPSSF